METYRIMANALNEYWAEKYVAIANYWMPEIATFSNSAEKTEKLLRKIIDIAEKKNNIRLVKQFGL
jgi:hypothetical protein